MEGTREDERLMRMALRLAANAQGQTSPNPMVGAVVVKGGRIMGTGYHRRAGGPHAEVEALRAAGQRANGSTLYITLEPCNHIGRTPPCCDTVLAAGVRRVVIGAKDPNPITNGSGIARLRRHGIDLTTGVLEEEARALNAPFEKTMRFGLPYAVAKIGQSLDGKIATRTGESRWITSMASRRYAHALRSRVDAILVGLNTILTDDPLLTVRGMAHRPDRPIKIIVDSRLRLPLTARCLLSSSSPNPCVVVTTVNRHSKIAVLKRRGVEVIVLPARKGRVPLRALFKILARRGIQSVLIEGGGEVLASALHERLVDRIAWCIAPLFIGGRNAPSSIGGQGVARLDQAVRLADLRIRRLGSDLCVEARVVYPSR